MEDVFLFSNVVSVDFEDFMLGSIKTHWGYTAFSTAYPRLKTFD